MARKKKNPVKRKKGAKAARRKAPTGVKPAIPFQSMSGDRFEALVILLLTHEVRRVGLSDGALDSFVAGNKGDGGVDAFLKSAPPRPSHFLPGRKTVFQFKLSCPKAASLLAELKKQARAQRLLSAGADYVLVTGSDVPPDEIEPLLNEGLRALVPSWSGQAQVWPANRVRQACLRNSATWNLVVDPKFSAHLSTWEEWSRDPRLDASAFRWSPDQARRQILESFYAEQSERRSWRIIGAPGVGKSRLVLEATRHLSDSVLVATSFTSDLIHLMRDLNVGWVVVDECTDEQHEALVALAAGTDTRIITMGRDTQPSASASEFLRLPVMAWKETVQLVPRSVTDLELRDTIARKAGGYPKLLRLSTSKRSSVGLFRASQRPPKSSRSRPRSTSPPWRSTEPESSCSTRACWERSVMARAHLTT